MIYHSDTAEKLAKAFEITSLLSEELAKEKRMTPIEISGQLAQALANDTAEAPAERGGAQTPDVPGETRSVVVAPSSPSLPPLHELETSLMALLDTEAIVSPEQEEAFLAELSQAMQTAKVKRDRVAAFIKEIEHQAEYASREIERLTMRKRRLVAAADKVRSYVLWILNALDRKKLEGDKFTFSARDLKPKLEITNEALISPDYKVAHVNMPAAWLLQWKGLLKELGLEASIDNTSFRVDEAALKEALEAAPTPCEECSGDGRVPLPMGSITCIDCSVCGGSGVIAPSIPGARLITDRKILVLR